MAENREISYNDAIAEVEQILASLGDGTADIDSLSERTKRATELIAAARAKLRKAENEISALLDEQPANQ